VAWRQGQDVVLNGREASFPTVALLHVTLCGKTLKAGTYGRLSPRLGRPSAAGPCVVVWPSLQPHPAYRGLRLRPWDASWGTRPTWARCSGRAVVPGTNLGTRLQCAHLALGTHKHRSVYL